jgi:hypothetical protein
MNRIAVYSANFGNYRKEQKNIDVIQKNNNIDYYFFTDNDDLKSEKWNIIVHPLESQIPCMDSFRHTSKHVKFMVPEVIKQYDIIVWIDCKSLTKNLRLDKDKITELFQNDPCKMFFIKHNRRKHAKEELKITCELKMENKEEATIFLKIVKDLTFSAPLPDTNCFVYKNNPENIQLLQKVYESLLEHGLKRDQNIIQYVWKTQDYEDRISFFKIVDIK